MKALRFSKLVENARNGLLEAMQIEFIKKTVLSSCLL